MGTTPIEKLQRATKPTAPMRDQALYSTSFLALSFGLSGANLKVIIHSDLTCTFGT